MRKILFAVLLFHVGLISACKKNSDPAPPSPASDFSISSWDVDGVTNRDDNKGTTVNPGIRLYFPAAIDRASVASAIVLHTAGYRVNYQNGDSTLVIQPAAALSYLSNYKLTVSNTLKSKAGGGLIFPVEIKLQTGYNTADKFPVISDSALLDKVQQQTFKYFWDFGHPVSGLARERSNGNNDVVTSGGSGFGIMAIPVAVSRNFITRADGLDRMQKIVGFLKNTAVKVKGAFPHWLNGSTGAIIPFSANDDGADLVETSYLMAGLLTARQYFNGADADETALRNDINELWNAVEWDWFRNGGQNVLYWHYSDAKQWIMNLPVQGWNECLITYILAVSSTTHSIPQSVYTNGWASGSSFLNGNAYYGYQLPLGPPLGGPLFFSHYSFLGINPNGLSDAYANYTTHTTNHSLINYEYCKANPRGRYGYGDSCWGLTASDIPGGYTASSPTNDIGVIAPTAAISSLPYTPAESMKALKFFYYVLGDKIWKEYGFVDAFSLHDLWFANSFLAIDQGPQIVMIENYRSGLLWNLFMSCPEVKAGMKSLGFSAPGL
ncbi:glucoamylase family protein [Agriterribacter sp.]|uniref:glucoamylase family protein n=3 Tax=Agriterribacter sp. TaxID=2821509 RepID=UPI002C9584D1|nr:glucoamylase family protein [Agriterribacter sp.]HRO48004.1 glucoamylase family protein [Agriterribacter sp.]